MKAQLITWNVGGFKPQTYRDISSLMENVGKDLPDLIVVGLQEIFEMKANNIARILNISDTSKRTNRWKYLLVQALHLHACYHLLAEDALAGIQVLVFGNKVIAENVTNIRVFKNKMGIMGFANKGAVIVSLNIFETPFKFAIAHLNAGCKQSESESRIEQINQIVNNDFGREVRSAS